ncbi:MAG: hydantoinase/oxoprolinase family protein [Betaproteobacteria bacterium]|nr:hydantoinase/oxoprolinase family protein [Betaproteobacteria bacterium]NBP36805.1 hydantoinase/oxoprolinase family protein [Betaproteobacteria bacterium]NCV13873.1 hydantoinase/oxoprolinase family protein [Betaproteobacteria bacterium]NCY05912.1 hydantoinase/oxoprolinase family protein [Betaproteobacteria bacterium]NDF48877.1 hydantoinase/oxoprolinase family protein [Betaproteobacteria bacterium]
MRSDQASYHVGVDIGGTFTDCVVVDEKGQLVAAKSPSTPPHFGQGMLAAMALAAQSLKLDFASFCQRIAVLTHGTTVGTNALIQRRGAKLGLITTKGHEDAIHIMRGSRGVSSRNLNQVVHFPESRKPLPIVSKRMIRGVSERVDCFGEVVVPLNLVQTREAIESLLAQGAESIAICLLWSFKNPAHEQQIAAMVRGLAPDCFVTCSVDLAPKWGEYERLTATALNAYIGPVTARYLSDLDRQLRDSGYRQALQITQCGGGSISVARAIQAPLLTLDSGPVSGVTGSQFLGQLIGTPNMITTDMGGTSFDVGIIHQGQPAFSFTANVAQYEYFIPKVDIQAIGSGGGSMASVDRKARTLRVGPESAGAEPGPACYGKGNLLATVTDADVVLGYIDPDNFLGGRIRLDKSKSIAAVDAVAQELGLSLMQAAAGIAKIAEFKMADIIRKTTVEKGLDPRDFVLFAFGGAGPVHAAVFARELGVRHVVIPLNRIASTWCAFGAATADILHIHEQVDIQASPFEPRRVRQSILQLMKKADKQMQADGIAAKRRRYQCSVDMRHRGQINEVEVPWPIVLPEHVKSLSAITSATIDLLVNAFYQRYESIYGKGSSYRDARLEMVSFRVRAMADTQRPDLPRAKPAGKSPVKSALTGKRPVYFDEAGQCIETPVYNGANLKTANQLFGPCIVETTDTTIVVRPDQRLKVDAWGNFELHFDASQSLPAPGNQARLRV